jgi:hypothetical protein
MKTNQANQAIEALKARDSKAQGKAVKQPQPWESEAKKKSPARATQPDCVALTGLNLQLVLFPRVPALRTFTLGFAAPHFQRFKY